MSQLLLLYALSTVLNAVQFTQFSTFPYVCKEADISDLSQGYIKTFFIALELVGSPLVGALVNKLGLRTGLAIVFISTACSCFLLSITNGTFLAVAAHVFGLLMVGHQAFQTAIAHQTKPGTERTNAFSRLGLSFGFGFLLTPIISKLATLFLGQRGPLIVGGWICLMTLPLLLLIKDKNDTKEDDSEKKKDFTTSGLTIILANHELRDVFAAKMLITCPAHFIFGVLQIYLINNFDMTQTQNSLIQLEIGLSIMFANIFTQSLASKYWNEKETIKVGAVVCSAMYVMFMRIDYYWMVFLPLFILVQGMSVVNNSADSLISSSIKHEQIGIVLGVSNSAISLTRAMSPTISALIVEELGFGYLGLVGLACSVAGYFIIKGKTEERTKTE